MCFILGARQSFVSYFQCWFILTKAIFLHSDSTNLVVSTTCFKNKLWTLIKDLYALLKRFWFVSHLSSKIEFKQFVLALHTIKTALSLTQTPRMDPLHDGLVLNLPHHRPKLDLMELWTDSVFNLDCSLKSTYNVIKIFTSKNNLEVISYFLSMHLIRQLFE